MQERRKSERRSISYYMRIVDAGANQLIGHLADINLEGLKMDSQKPLPVNKEYLLRINTSSDVADKDHIKFTALSRWCLINPLEPGLYDVGFKIINMDTHDSEIVQRIMDKYGIRK